MTISRTRLQNNFNRAAAHYDAHASFQAEQTQRLFAYAQTILVSDSHLLDIGCGTGQFANYAKKSQTKWRITGLDIAAHMCQRARAHQAATLQADASALPFAGERFDAIISSLCLQWIEDKKTAFDEIYRVLKPGGNALLITLADATLQELRETAATLHVPLMLLPLLPTKNYQHYANNAGFKVLEMHDTIKIRPYDSTKALLHSMQIIGAKNANETVARTRITRTQMQQLFAHYDAHYASESGVYASWQPLLMHVKKPA